MSITVILGTQWGDEGKGKATDRLAAESDIVARFNGGDNAGHTLTVGDEIYKLHLVPSGILYPGVMCVMGGGMAVNPRSLLREMDSLAERGVDVSAARLKLSGRAHLILPYHIALDGAAERALGKKQIGTTMNPGPQRNSNPGLRPGTTRCRRGRRRVFHLRPAIGTPFG
jgi:adenylosuccinate synthase